MHKAFDDRDDQRISCAERAISEIHNRLDSQHQLLQSILSTNQEILRKINSKEVQEEMHEEMHEEIIAPWKPAERIDIPDIGEVAGRLRVLRFDKQGEKNIYSALVASRMAWFYRRYLKRYPIIRATVINIWRSLVPIILRTVQKYFPQRFNKVSLQLVPLKDYSSRHPEQVFVLHEQQPIVPISPRVYPAEDRSLLRSGRRYDSCPEIYVALIEDGIIYGASNLVFKEHEAICHDFYDFVCDSTSEELHFRALINSETKRICWLRHDPFPEFLDAAATFVDACSENYSHWLTEVLPRIALFVNDARFEGVPIIVNERLHPNLMKSLLLVVRDGRMIYRLQKDKAVKVSKLYVVSVTGYVPFDQRSVPGQTHSHGRFSPVALCTINKSFIRVSDQLSRQDWPTKLYLRRKGIIRQLVNQSDIEGLLVSRGFTVIDTDKLSFAEQVALFSRAKLIVAPTGASLANAVFAGPDAEVVVLMAKHEKMIYRYWAEMLSPLKLNVSYVLGQIVQKKGYGIHGNFKVSESDLVDALIN